MATFRELSGDDVKSARSFLNQLVDVLQEDISGSTTRKKYAVYVTGGIGPGVTSSQFQTIFDQDFTLQTANPIFDMTIGLASGSDVITNANPIIDTNGKYLFSSQTLMMREKMDNYRQFAQTLLGGVNEIFTLTSGSSELQIKEGLFLGFKRLFARDQIKRETFAIKMYVSAAHPDNPNASNNLNRLATSASIYTDISSSVNKELSVGGQVSTIVDSANVNRPVGLLYIDRGIAVLDIARIIHPATEATETAGAGLFLTGTIRAVSPSGLTPFTGSVKQFLASGSIDDIVDHFATTRFSGSSQTALTFQNITNINSTLYFCRLSADEFNYSSNPTYTDTNNRIVVIDEGQEESQTSFTFVTSIGLYDSSDNLMAVAKTSRPLLKDSERDITLKVRLDFFARPRIYITKRKISSKL